jgi:uncharacterized iron-regulated membrane protein
MIADRHSAGSFGMMLTIAPFVAAATVIGAFVGALVVSTRRRRNQAVAAEPQEVIADELVERGWF